MTRFAFTLAPLALLASCSSSGSAPYTADPIPFALPSGYATGPVQNSCAYGGPCLQGGYSTHHRGHGAPVQRQGYAHGPQHPAAHAYGAAHHPGGYGPGYGMRGYSQPGMERGYAYANAGATLYDLDSSLAGVQGRLGYQSASVLGAEVEGSLGVVEDDFAGIDGSVDYQIAGFALARAPLSERFSLHTRGGYHATKVDAALGGVTGSETVDGFAYGAGAEYRLTPRSGLRADYTRYHASGYDGALEGLSLAYSHRF